jgi:hypothetical protein
LIIRLILTPPQIGTPEVKKWKYTAVREDTGEEVVRSHTPLYDGARELLKRGLSPDTLLTMRHVSSPHDSFTPQRIGELARWAIDERDNKSGLRKVLYRPRGGTREGQNIRVEGIKAADQPSQPNALYERSRVIEKAPQPHETSSGVFRVPATTERLTSDKTLPRS